MGDGVDGFVHKNTPYCERQLEQWQLERERQSDRQPEWLECQQPGVLSQLLFFSHRLCESFCFQSFLPATDHLSKFMQVFGQDWIFIRIE